jgi:hypothetical protein
MKAYSKSMTNLLKKKVMPHLKEDTKEFKEQIADDKKLKSQLKKGMKKPVKKK